MTKAATSAEPKHRFSLQALFHATACIGALLAMLLAGDGPDRVAWGWALFFCLFIPSAIRDRPRAANR